jgi:cytochrome b561
MPLMNTPKAYGGVAMTAHWLIVLMLLGSFSLGFYMHELPLSPTKLKLYAYHKWLGVTIFVVAVLRLGWRLWSPPPALPASMPSWEKRAADISHHLLYLLLFAAPLSGWLMSSAKGFQTVWFGLWPIPDLLAKNPPLGEALESVHETLTFMLLGVIVLHVAAALKHHFIDRDEVLARMTPGLSAPQPTRPAGPSS